MVIVMNIEDKWIYIKEDDNIARYVLGVSGSTPLIFFGVNPSTAAPNNLDNTVRNVVKLAEKQKYDSWIMLNIYPQRDKNPDGMHFNVHDRFYIRNLEEIENVLKSNRGSILIAGWGNLIEKRSYLKESLRDIYDLSVKYQCSWKCIDQNKSGHPKHPLYVSISNSNLKEFDIKAQYNL